MQIGAVRCKLVHFGVMWRNVVQVVAGWCKLGEVGVVRCSLVQVGVVWCKLVHFSER